MPALVQLTLWVEDPDHIEAQCPRCGHHYNVAPQLPADDRDRVLARVLQHPKVKRLRDSQRRFLEDVPLHWLGGAAMGPAELSRFVPLTKQGVGYQLRVLERRGLVATEPKRAGGTYKVYRFKFPNGTSPQNS